MLVAAIMTKLKKKNSEYCTCGCPNGLLVSTQVYYLKCSTLQLINATNINSKQ